MFIIYSMANVLDSVQQLLYLSQSGTCSSTAVTVTSRCCNYKRHTCVVMCVLVQAGLLSGLSFTSVLPNSYGELEQIPTALVKI